MIEAPGGLEGLPIELQGVFLQTLQVIVGLWDIGYKETENKL